MRVYVDATPLYNLGQTGALEVLLAPELELVIPTAVRDEITVEPAATNIERFLDEESITTAVDAADWEDDAMAILDTAEKNGDVALVAGLLADRDRGVETVLVSDDRRLRAIGEALDATVTGTFGMIVRASLDDKYFSTNQVKRLVRRVDNHGVQMTGQLRERTVGAVDS